MELTLDIMPENARLWIYQANRPFTPEEEQEITEITAAFVSQWAAHGQRLKAAFSIEHHQFIILAVDESYNLASGCSIDDSVGFIRQIERKFHLTLLDRTQVAFLLDGRVHVLPLTTIKEAVSTGKIDQETRVFNNAIDNAGDWKTNWIIPAKDTWLRRYFH